jgi:hypothetical protein
VPFQPKADKPVFCKKCWPNHRVAHNKSRKNPKRNTLKH